MALVTLDRREAEPERLPPVCTCCGAPSAEYRSKNFSWHPPWIGVLILAGLLPYALVALILTKRMTVSAPLCERHRGHWTVRTVVTLGGFLALVLLGFVAAMVLGDHEGPGGDPVGGFLCLGTLGLGVVWLILALSQALEEQRDEEERRYREENRDFRRELGGKWRGRDRAPRPEPGDRYTERPGEGLRRPPDGDEYRER
jgi:hypothetical protein